LIQNEVSRGAVDMAFTPHGEYEISVRGDTIRADARGPFNREAIAVANELFLSASRSLSGQRHFQLTKFRDNPLMTPAALEIANERLKAQIELGLAAVAFVLPPGTESSVAEYERQVVFSSLPIPSRVFDSIESAERWIGELRRETDAGTGAP
jgi:hypothetical protein